MRVILGGGGKGKTRRFGLENDLGGEIIFFELGKSRAMGKGGNKEGGSRKGGKHSDFGETGEGKDKGGKRVRTTEARAGRGEFEYLFA